MNTTITIGIATILAAGLTMAFADDAPGTSAGASQPDSIYDIDVETIDGKTIKLDEYKGDVLLIVNVASKCGLTDRNYKALEPLYRKYKDKGFRILAFPANDFLSQEPGTHDQIKAFCKKYDVSFDLFAKVHVKGDEQCPLYKRLTEHPNPEIAGPVEWNFQKYLVDRTGQVIAKFSPKTDPDNPKLVEAIEKALEQGAPTDDTNG